MHITMLALGSTGDVLPLAALGRGLQQAGHAVLLGTYETYAEMVEKRGLTFHPIRGDGKQLMGSVGGRMIAGGGQNPRLIWRGIRKSFGAQAAGYAEDLTALLEVPTDLILNQIPGGLYGMDLAEKLDIPMILAAVIPLSKTRTRPMLAFPSGLSFLPGYSSATYYLAEQLLWRAFRPVINRWRQEKLQLPKQPFWGRFQELGTDRYPIMYGISSLVVPRAPDWAGSIHLTGYWYPQDADWQPDQRLVRFIQAGSPPVFIGFGSMPLSEPQNMLQIILHALQHTGLRAVLHRGWAGLQGDMLPDTVHLIDYAPYTWLFPRMAAIIHHGGSGTTAFGLRSGVPSLAVPFAFDQFFWGRKIAELGVGPDPIPVKKLSQERFTRALWKMTTDQQMRINAGIIRAKLLNENGIQSAVTVIEEYLH